MIGHRADFGLNEPLAAMPDPTLGLGLRLGRGRFTPPLLYYLLDFVQFL